MRVLSTGLLLSTLALAACDQGARDQGLASEVTTSDLTATDSPTSDAAPVKSARPSGTARRTPPAATTRVPAREPVVVVHRHTKRDAAIGAGAGAVIGGVTHGTKGAIVGGVVGGAAGAIIGHKVDKHTEVIR